MRMLFIVVRMEPTTVLLTLSQSTQLALLTTLSADRSVTHTRSVLLVHRADEPGSELALIEGLTFTLTLSVPATLPIEALLDAMHNTYYDEALRRVDVATRQPGGGDNNHPLYTVAAINQANYELSRSNEPTDEAGIRRILSLRFVKRHQAFAPSKQSLIYNKLIGKAKSGASRVAGPVQSQWRLTFENHAILQYFLDKFRNGRFKIRREFCEVRVLCCTADHKVTFMDYGDHDYAQRYVLAQLPAFAAKTASVLWQFDAPLAPLQDCYIHNATQERTPPCLVEWSALRGEARLTAGRVACNMLDFDPIQLQSQCHLYDYTRRVQCIARDTREIVNKTQIQRGYRKPVPDKKRTVQTSLLGFGSKPSDDETGPSEVIIEPPSEATGEKRAAETPLDPDGVTKRPRLDYAGDDF